jgi:lysophospholipase L1-like esterase
MQSKIELKPNQTIVFIGDSITDAGRREPEYAPFGRGYVHFVANTLLARYPTLDLNIINAGISGNTIRELKARWENDCLQHKPDVLTVLVGINDLYWQHVDFQEPSQAVYADEYELTYRQLLSRARQQQNCQIVLMEPFMFCDDLQNEMRLGLRTYIEIVHKLADEFRAVLVPLQSCIDRQIKQVPPQMWSADSVHPYQWTHAWIAQRWFEATAL